MALENTTTSSVGTGFNALLSKLDLASGFNDSKATNSTNSSTTPGNEAEKGGESLPSIFSLLLEQQSQTNEPVGTSDTVADTSADNKEVISAASLAEDVLSPLTTMSNALSDDAIVAMQGTLLTALQNNIFQALSTNSDTTNTATTSATSDLSNANINQSEASPTLFDTLYTNAFGDDGLNLKDGFDVLNIANHLPIVSDVYEATTSSHTAAAASLAGSFLYGGIGGLMYNAVDLAVENVTGQSISNNLWSMGQALVSSSFSEINADSASQVLDESVFASTPIETNDIKAGIANKAADATYQFVQRGLN
ncbi:hypothetical protein BM523_01990 [Alteromonas mediterranea]|uniref:hypothetical protein n=1 Tax=Alteromonas mediterranea TaxID=314275 RepID=UPI0009035415|nr:hypothetical protein [Alteromonas mediterranea]APD92869.1 hypothetical protein BM523_01990 [Alteromonas mediterranea]APD96483.1 hypothetical protein BM525_01975 [Alteromonas mediterranea]QGX60532.1 hypothetical protein FJN15_01690 [Alteromonas mediterranea]